MRSLLELDVIRGPIEIVGGRRCLALVNTSPARRGSEALRDFAELLRWGVAIGLLMSDSAEALWAASSPADWRTSMERSLVRRGVLVRIFDSAFRRQAPDPTDLAALSALSRQHSIGRHLVFRTDRFLWEGSARKDPLRWLDPVFADAAALLIEHPMRITLCAAYPIFGCERIFLHQRPGQPRSYCSRRCADRARAQRRRGARGVWF